MKKVTAILFSVLLLFPCRAFSEPSAGVKRPTKIRVLRPAANAELPKIRPVPFNAPEIKEFVTPKGIKVWLVEEKDAPLISASVLCRGGSASDPERLTG